MDHHKLRIALLKQVVLPDLYVCPTKSTLYEILFSSMMRVGPLGLFYEFDTDFFIVDVEEAKECQIWKEINRTPINGPVELLLELKNKTLNQIAGQEFKDPGSKYPNGYYATDVNSINWQKYDIVISINISVPTNIVKKYPDILWCYLLMEPDSRLDKVYFGYDVVFNHNASGIPYFIPGIIDFPFTFLHKNLLYKIMQEKLGRESLREGIFCDISCSKDTNEEKKILNIPVFLEPLKKTNQKLIIHNQSIYENIKLLYDSKYFIKIGGFYIRGNSIIEAISAGTLVIGDPEKTSLNILIPEECQVKSVEEAIILITNLEKSPTKYLELLYTQQALVDLCVIKRPVESLYHLLKFKRENGYYKNTFIAKLTRQLKRHLF